MSVAVVGSGKRLDDSACLGPLVSVVIPTFGRARHLADAIDSVLAQTYKNIEIVVVDDNPPNSIDRIETKLLLERYSANDAFIYTTHEENKGGAAARNTGVRMSAGELITFLDDDDTYHKEKLEKQVEHITAEQLDVSLCAAEIVFHDKASGGYDCYPHATCLRDFILFGAAVTPMIMIKRKTFLKANGFADTPRFQDHVFMIRVHEAGAKVGILPHKLYTQNIHAGPRVSYSEKSKLGYEIKHEAEARNFHVLSEREIQRVVFRQQVELLPYTKKERGLSSALVAIAGLLLDVRRPGQLWTLAKSLIKAFIR